MNYSLDEIARTLGIADRSFPRLRIDTLLTDSRSLLQPQASLFFALVTDTNDGHRYIPDLYRQGVRAFVVNHIPEGSFPGATFLEVEDTGAALRLLGQSHRERFDIPVVAITGSRGKTVVKEWLYQLLSPTATVARSIRSYNSRIGVPLSLWEIDEASEVALIEAGISKTGEMNELNRMIRPTVAIVTNVGAAHAEGFASRAEHAAEKARIAAGADMAIYCLDDPDLASAFAGIDCPKKIGWSSSDPAAPIYIINVSGSDNASTAIRYRYEGKEATVVIPFADEASVENAITCLAYLLATGMDGDTIARRMAGLTHVGTRLNVVEGVNNCLLVYDNYTCDYHSLLPALDFMARRAVEGRTLTAVLGDMAHETLSTEDTYRAMAETLCRRGVGRVIAVGPEISRHLPSYCTDATLECFGSTDELLGRLSPSDFQREMVLIKGAPGMGFDKILTQLEARQHETVLEVNLDAMVANFNYFRSKLKPTTGLVAMVKASGYGAGAYELAKTLQSHGAAYLAVAVLDEGVELRRGGITMPIMVLNPKVLNYRLLFSNNLEPEIYSFEMLDEIIREARKNSVRDFPVHIKLDTGMHRLGFLEADLPRLIATVKAQENIRIRSVFSHLATADCLDMDDYTAMQFDVFERCSSLIVNSFPYPILRHILNSAGILRFPDHQYDMARLGIGLYGVRTLPPEVEAPLSMVSTLRSVVISIKEWEAGTTIGYSRRGLLKRRSRIATVPVGYADGIDRRMGNGHVSFIVNGRPAPTVGNICMDICMIDVTDCDCAVGDAVEIFGPNNPVEPIAEALGTIPYELLTSVSTRVKRLYYRE